MEILDAGDPPSAGRICLAIRISYICPRQAFPKRASNARSAAWLRLTTLGEPYLVLAMHNGNATFRRPPCYTARPGALATRPPGDTSGVGLARRHDPGSGRTERPMDAIIKPWPLGTNPPLTVH